MRKRQITDEMLKRIRDRIKDLSRDQLNSLEKGEEIVFFEDQSEGKYVYIRRRHRGEIEAVITNIEFYTNSSYRSMLELFLKKLQISHFSIKNCTFSNLVGNILVTDKYIEYVSCFFEDVERIEHLVKGMEGGHLAFLFCDFNSSEVLIQYSKKSSNILLYYSRGIQKLHFRSRMDEKWEAGATQIFKMRNSKVESLLFSRAPSLRISLRDADISICKLSFKYNTPVAFEAVDSKIHNLIIQRAYVEERISFLNSEIENYKVSEAQFEANSMFSMLDIDSSRGRIVDCDLSSCSFKSSNSNLDNVFFSRNKWSLSDVKAVKNQFAHKNLEDLRITLSEMKASHRRSHDFEKVDTFKVLEYTVYREELYSKKTISKFIEYLLLSFDYWFSRHLTSPIIIISWTLIIPFVLSLINVFAVKPVSVPSLTITKDLMSNLELLVSFFSIILKNMIGLLAPILKYEETFLLSKKIFYPFKIFIYPYVIYQLVMTLRKYSRIA